MASTRMAMAAEEIDGVSARDEASGAGVSWPAVFAGAFTMGGLTLILSILGAGIGLSSVSLWGNDSVQTSRISAGAIVWLILIQILASAIGGYLAVRLRTKWVSLHTHENYFRDTAHGFIAWAVALVISVLLLISYATTIAGRTAATPAVENTSGNYFVDMLFRTEHPATTRIDQPLRGEAGLILANSLRHPEMSKDDQSYLATLVSAVTGLNREEAERRVFETIAADRYAADTARKAIAHSLYWLFVAFLIGAFCASFAATIGGRQRDNVPALHK